MRLRHFASFFALFIAASANAQVNHVALGDKEYAALNASAALAHYKEAAADKGIRRVNPSAGAVQLLEQSAIARRTP